jgi:hypothetical protein
LGKFCHQSLAFSGFMVLSKQLGTLKKTKSDHNDVIDLQVGALERGQIYNSKLDDLPKRIFQVGARLFPTSHLS